MDPARELDRILSGLVRDTSVMKLIPDALADTTQLSHFGGRPNIKPGESWPCCRKCGQPMTFICQVDLRQTVLVEAVPFALVSFFYCFECNPWGGPAEPPGMWILRPYRESDLPSLVLAKLGPHIPGVKPCAISFRNATVLPDWESIENYDQRCMELSSQIKEKSPWEAYQAACERLAGPQEIQGRVGGYPKWIQGDESPDDAEFLMQVDSDDNAGIMWGDVGSVYLFHSPGEGAFHLRFQCC